MATLEWPAPMRGDQDQAVRTIQHLLNHHGGAVTPDGVFGAHTESAVRAFQENKELPANGVVGNETWEALIVELEFGSRGDAVRAAQTQLFIRGTLPEVDGIYSMKMNISVHRFQVLKRLATSGTVDRATWKALVGDKDLPAASADLSRDGFDWQTKLRSMLRPES